MASVNDHIELKILLRDIHEELMQGHLTDGSQSIPKLICIDRKSGEEIGSWGPRPIPAQKFVNNRLKHSNVIDIDFRNKIHEWYNIDENQSIQEEFIELINKWTQNNHE